MLLIEPLLPPLTDVIRVRGPLDHYDLFPLSSCSCVYCEGCRTAREALDLIAADIARTDCDCDVCERAARKGFDLGRLWAHARGCHCEYCHRAEPAWRLVVAAQNRRDVWSEMSYHATHDIELVHHRLGADMMLWLEGEMVARGDTRWWSNRAGAITIGDWLRRFHSVLSAASGINLRPLSV